MAGSGVGALYLLELLQAMARAKSAIRFMVVLLQAGAGDQRDRQPRQRVLEQVFESPVVEEGVRFEVDPDGPDGARTDAGVQQELRGLERGAIGVAGHLAGEAGLGVAFEAVAAASEA